MGKKLLSAAILSALFAVILCTQKQNPYTIPGNARVSLLFRDSKDLPGSDLTVNDTVGHTVKVGISQFLPEFIDSTWISMLKYSNGIDSLISLKKFSSESDTQWFDFTFTSARMCSVSVKAFIQGGTQYVVNGVITILGKQVFGSIHPAIDTIPVDSLELLSVNAMGDGPFAYQWNHGTTSLSGKTDVTLAMSHLAFTDSGTYSCLITDKWGDTATSSVARLFVVPKKIIRINTKPVLVVSGPRNILATEICSLTVSATDPDSGQKDSIVLLKGPQGCKFTGNVFTWTPPASFLGSDTAVFVVVDNGTPPLSDTQAAVIVVSSAINAPDSVKGVAGVSRVGGNFIFKWNKVANADAYIIYRSKDTTGFVPYDTASDTTFANSIRDTAFYYYIVAANSKGLSAPSSRIRSTVINTAPKWSHSSFALTMNEGTLFSLNLADSVTDANGDNVTIQLENGNPSTDSIVGMTWKFSPTYFDSGTDTVKIKAWDGTDSSILSISLHVVNVPRPPQPQAQNLSTKRNTALQITMSAISPDGDAITSWTIDTTTTHGATVLVNNAQPNVTYTPTTGFIGTDYFLFKASVGNLASTYSAKVTIKVDTNNVAPHITQVLTAMTANKGDSVTFTVGINSDVMPAPLYSWFKAGTFLDSTRVNSWKKTNLALADSGYYYVLVSNVMGKDSSGAKLTMQNAPVISPKLPATTTFVSGNSTALTVAINPDATPAPTYKWYFNAGEISGATANSCSKTWAIADTGTYKVVVSNAAGKDSSLTKLVVNVAPIITAQPQALKILEHLTISLNVQAGGTAPLTFQWRKNGGNIATNGTGQSYSLPNAAPSDSGDYTVVITNLVRSCTSSVAHVSVLPTYSLTTTSSPSIGGAITRSKDTTAYARGDTVALTAVPATGYRFSGWTGDLSGTTNPTKLPINAARSVTANFIKQFSLTVTVPTGGTVTKTPNQTMYDSNSMVTLSASNALNYGFYGWTGDTTTQSRSLSLTMNSNKNLLANFIPGYNWTTSNAGLTDTIVKTLAVNGTIIYAGTLDSGVYLSTNNGTSWNRVDTGLTGLNVNSLACLGSIVFAGSDSGVFRSNDSGKTWSKAGGAAWACNSLAANGTGIYGGTLGSLYFSPDSAKTWSQEFSGMGGTTNAIAAKGNTILAANRSAIMRSQDYGASWYSVLVIQYLGVRAFTFSGSNIFAGSSSYGLFRSSDSGSTWTKLDSTISTWALASYGTSLFAGEMGTFTNSASDIFISIDNGDHWFPQNSGLNAQAFAIIGKSIFVGTNGQGGLYKASLP